jgi:hypothetical protein
MKFQLKESAKSLKARLIVSLLAFLGGVAVSIFSQLGFLLMPLLAAPLAVVFIAEIDSGRIFSIVVPILVVALDVAFNLCYSFNCISAVLVAVIIYLAVRYGFLAKSESAILALVLASAIAVVSFFMLGCFHAGSFDFEKVMTLYNEIIAQLETFWTDAMKQYILADETGELATLLTDGVISEMFALAVNSAFSLLVGAVFLAVGLSYKLFERMMIKRTAFPEALAAWRFSLTPVYAVFYIALAVFSMFAEGDAFGIVILNLNNIFMFIFAYLGYLFASAFLRMRTRIRSAKMLLILAILMFSSTAVSILSYVGVFATFMLDKAEKNGTNRQGGNTL